jgi:hypothetical protein
VLLILPGLKSDSGGSGGKGGVGVGDGEVDAEGEAVVHFSPEGLYGAIGGSMARHAVHAAVSVFTAHLGTSRFGSM